MRNTELAEVYTRQVALTPKEERCVELVLRGCSNQTIAGIIGTTESLVKNHLRFAYDKLGVTSRYELVHQAIGDWQELDGGIRLWQYDGVVMQQSKTYETAADKHRAEVLRKRRLEETAQCLLPEYPSWAVKFKVPLTRHEVNLIALVLEQPDATYEQLASKLHGSTATGVDTALWRIYSKAGVKSKAGLVAFLLK